MQGRMRGPDVWQDRCASLKGHNSLPGRLELPTLRLTASRSNQLSYGSSRGQSLLMPLRAGARVHSSPRTLLACRAWGLDAVRPDSERPRGPMGKAWAYGVEDCRFESCRGHHFRQPPQSRTSTHCVLHVRRRPRAISTPPSQLRGALAKRLESDTAGVQTLAGRAHWISSPSR